MTIPCKSRERTDSNPSMDIPLIPLEKSRLTFSSFLMPSFLLISLLLQYAWVLFDWLVTVYFRSAMKLVQHVLNARNVLSELNAAWIINTYNIFKRHFWVNALIYACMLYIQKNVPGLLLSKWNELCEFLRKIACIFCCYSDVSLNCLTWPIFCKILGAYPFQCTK